jgi:hypothetical protein
MRMRTKSEAATWFDVHEALLLLTAEPPQGGLEPGRAPPSRDGVAEALAHSGLRFEYLSDIRRKGLLSSVRQFRKERLGPVRVAHRDLVPPHGGAEQGLDLPPPAARASLFSSGGPCCFRLRPPAPHP